MGQLFNVDMLLTFRFYPLLKKIKAFELLLWTMVGHISLTCEVWMLKEVLVQNHQCEFVLGNYWKLAQTPEHQNNLVLAAFDARILQSDSNFSSEVS